MIMDNCSDRLYVGGFSSTLSSEQIKTLITQTSQPFDVSVEIVENGSRRHRGFAFVQCQNQSEAAILLTKYLTVFTKVNFAKKENKPPTTVMSNISNVFVRGLSKDLTDSKLFELFGGSSEGVVQCHVADGYGFVLFDTRKNAEKKIEEMDGKLINGLKLSLSWARPDTSCRKRKRALTEGEQCQQNLRAATIDLAAPILKRSIPIATIQQPSAAPFAMQLAAPFFGISPNAFLNPSHIFVTNPAGHIETFFPQQTVNPPQLFNFLL